MEEENEHQIEGDPDSNVQKAVTNKTQLEVTESETGIDQDEDMISVDNKQPSDTEIDATESDDKKLKDQNEEMRTVDNKKPSDTEVDATESDDKK